METDSPIVIASPCEAIQVGRTSNLKTVGGGVLECRIDWEPGYRTYLGRDGDTAVILLTGGTRQRQQRDIEQAKVLWADYKRRREPATRQRKGEKWH